MASEDAALRIRQVTRRHRRLIAGLCAAIATVSILSYYQPPQAQVRDVLVAARSLPAGHPVTHADLTLTSWPADHLPDFDIVSGDAVVGRLTAGPVAAGEPLTTLRLVGPDLIAASGFLPSDSEHLVAAPVRVHDAASAALIRPGDTIDIYAAYPGGLGGGQRPPATRIATGVPVLVTPESAGTSGGGWLGASSPSTSGALIVVAVGAEVAAELAGAAASGNLSVTLTARQPGEPPKPAP